MERFEEGVANKAALNDDIFYDEGDVDDQIGHYQRHLMEVQCILNERFLEWHNREFPLLGRRFPLLKADFSNAIAAAPFIMRHDSAGYVLAAMRNGQRIYKESLETVLDVYEAVYLLGHVHTIAVGGTNLGKTSASHFLRFLAGLLNDLVFGQKTCILNIYITRRNIVNQSQESFKALAQLYGAGEIINTETGKHPSLGAYHKGAVMTIFERGFEQQRFNDLNQSRNKEEIVEIAKTAQDKGMALLVEVDEIHHGPRATGALGDKMDDLAPDHDPARAMSETLEAVRKLVRPRAIIGFSATPDPTLNEPWHLVPMRYSPIYASCYQHYRGFKIADIRIPVWSQTEFYAYSGIDLATIDTSVLADDVTRNESPDVIEDMYWTALNAVQWCFQWQDGRLDQNRQAPIPDFNPARREFRGAMIRLERSNDRCDDFADFIEANSTLRVLRFYNTKRNKNKNKGNIRAQLQEIIDSGVYFVVLATGALRMADDLPRDVVYFFDYTHRTNYPSALRQGTPGRAGGHGKVSLVILSDINAQQVRDNDEENKSRFPKTNPSQHTTMGGRAAGLNNTLHRQARIPIRETSPIELCNKIVPFQDYLEAEAVRKFGDIPASLDWSVRFDTERGNKSGLLPPVEHFRDLLSMLEREFLATRPNVASVQFLGFDGDEITLEPDEVGPRFRYFDPRAPWSLRDRRKIDKSVRAMRAKAWRSKGGMVVQVVWDIVGPDGFTPAKVGTLRIVELIWPIKTIVDLSETSGTAAGYVPKPKGYTWQHKRYERAQA